MIKTKSIQAAAISANCMGCTATICLPTKPTNHGDACFISGWGATQARSTEQLREAVVNIFSEDYCTTHSKFGQGGNPEVIYGREFCAGLPAVDGNVLTTGGVDACHGDSGGSMTCLDKSNGSEQPVLQGMISWGRGCAQDGYPGVYVDVYHFVQWINNVMDGTISP